LNGTDDECGATTGRWNSSPEHEGLAHRPSRADGERINVDGIGPLFIDNGKYLDPFGHEVSPSDVKGKDFRFMEAGEPNFTTAKKEKWNVRSLDSISEV
jgi:hypothetical protein